MWNGVPAPATVMRSFCMTGIAVAGTNASMNTSLQPDMSAENVQVWPPMWVYGNTRPNTSSSVSERLSVMASAEARTDGSVCFAPFGSAVVPDE